VKEAFFIAQKIRKSSGPSVIAPLLKLSVVATALGMALVVLSITSGKGLQKSIIQQFSSIEGDISMSAYSVQRTAEPRPILLEDSLITALENAPYTTAVFPGIQKSALLVNPSVDAFEGIQISGMSRERWSYFAAHHTLDGPSHPTQRYGSFISKTLSRELGLYTGDTAVLVLLKNQQSAPRLRKSVIEGVYQTGLDEYNRSNILMNLEDVRRLQGWKNDSVSNYTVVLSDAQQRADLAAYWNAIVPYSIQVSSVEQKHPAIFGWLELFDTNIALVLGIVLIVALSNLVTALLVLIIDRTRMIGTLKALGSSNRLILQVFQWLSLRILSLGLLWGNAIGLGVSFIQWKFGVIHLDPETYYIATAPIAFDGWWILGANFGFLLIAYFVLRIPVAWIAKIDPIKSIRFA
jgi:lipoprotein-releasing system permease protein